MKLTELLKERLVRAEFQLSALTGGLYGVLAVDITNPGSVYSSAPSVTIADPASGTTATAEAEIANGQVVKVNLLVHGSGYSTGSVPAVTFGTGAAAATARVAAATLDAIPTTLLQPGTTIVFALAGVVQLYQLTYGTDAESSPAVIRPDDYHGTTNAKVWKRSTFTEIASAANVGTGEGVFKQLSGTELQFYKIKAGTNVTVTKVDDDLVISSGGGGGSDPLLTEAFL